MNSLLGTVLCITTAEHGQSNVHFATVYELALAGVNVCISSFASLEPRVSHLQKIVARRASCEGALPTGSISFRELKGLTPYWNAAERHGINQTTLAHPPGVSGALESYRKAAIMVFPWNPEEHLAGIKMVKEMIMEIKPPLVLVDGILHPAVDACRDLGQKFMILFPMSIKEAAGGMQPRLAALWKYPVFSSGFQYPLKWWQIPLNIYLAFRISMQLMTSTSIARVKAMRKSLGIKTLENLQKHGGVKYICPALPETDFPFDFIPEAMVLCGPIIVPFDPVGESDIEMNNWLNNGPTILVCLGSLATSNEKNAREMAGAFRILLDHHNRKGGGRMQVLWKAKASGNTQEAIEDIIGKEIKEGRVKMVAWLEAEPVSILQHPNVVCTVHHGGANSFFEGVWSGVPHIVLPIWFDTYDFANRVEFLNIGVFGSKTTAPGTQAEEFGRALVRVTADTHEAAKFRTAAKRLQSLCRAKGSGRKLACMAVMKEAGLIS